jgi:hypothetical protein
VELPPLSKPGGATLVPTVRTGDLLFVSGHGPTPVDGLSACPSWPTPILSRLLGKARQSAAILSLAAIHCRALVFQPRQLVTVASAWHRLRAPRKMSAA